MTHCQCPLAGYCQQHRVIKNQLLHHKCKNDPHFFNAWEEGKGPGQKPIKKSTQVYTTGTELKKLISWFPILENKECLTCKSLETKMNNWGPDICEQKKEYILKKLEIAAKRRSLPFSQRLVTILVDKAIRNSR